MPTTNPHQPTPSAGVSKRLSLPSSAHHSPGPSDIVVSPQAESPPISAHSDLPGSGSGSGSGNPSAHRQSMSTASMLTLAGASVEEQVQPTLRATERALISVDRTARRHKLAMNIACGVLAVLGALAYVVAGATTGTQTNVATAILGGGVSLVAVYLVHARGRGEPEASSLGVRDLEIFIDNMRVLIDNHGHRRGSAIGPEIKARVVWNRQRFKEILRWRIWEWNTLADFEDTMKADKKIKTAVAAQKGKTEEPMV
ncbi:hypothetical protein LXA43DRAFT_80751 [Ganoderma leucocontextum]|nr:hypothetical protein LXA43DRAFT_80751 [Ganoderma leucocontextum]